MLNSNQLLATKVTVAIPASSEVEIQPILISDANSVWLIEGDNVVKRLSVTPPNITWAGKWGWTSWTSPWWYYRCRMKQFLAFLSYYANVVVANPDYLVWTKILQLQTAGEYATTSQCHLKAALEIIHN